MQCILLNEDMRPSKMKIFSTKSLFSSVELVELSRSTQLNRAGVFFQPWCTVQGLVAQIPIVEHERTDARALRRLIRRLRKVILCMYLFIFIHLYISIYAQMYHDMYNDNNDI